MLHGGEPITRGRRYILAVFAYLGGASPTASPCAHAAAAHRRQAARASSSSSTSAATSASTSAIDGESITRTEEGSKPPKRVLQQDACVGFGNVQWKAAKVEKCQEEEDSKGDSRGLFSFKF